MTMLPITSSMLSAIGYDADSLTLFVQFHPSKKQVTAGVAGDLWAYKNVIPERWAEMQAAESVGKWFLANVRGRYEGGVVVAEISMENGSEIRFSGGADEFRSIAPTVGEW